MPDRQVRWFDVDTSAALEYKQQLLAARPTLHSRCCVKADFTDAAQVEQGLLQAGRQRVEPRHITGGRRMTSFRSSCMMWCHGTAVADAGQLIHASLSVEPFRSIVQGAGCR